MTRALLETCGDRLVAGVVAMPGGEGIADARLQVHAAGHPLPTAESVAAGRGALEIAERAQGGSRLVVLLSGGASALIEAPAGEIALDDLVDVTRALLRAGTPIAPFNAVRKHLSAFKGGQLALRARRSITLAISDVHAPIEDDPAVIGSGPTVADPSTFAEADAALRRVEHVPETIRRHIARGLRGEIAETPKPGDPRLADAAFVLAGGRRDAMAGAAARARALGYRVQLVDPPVVGEARHAGVALIEQARVVHDGRPLCVIASGETTVTVRGKGKGGRNQEVVLGALEPLAHCGPCAFGSIGSDGVDGPTDAAGAIADESTLERAHAAGLDPERALADNDAYPFFQSLGDLVITGPTGTNVGDVQVLLVQTQ